MRSAAPSSCHSRRHRLDRAAGPRPGQLDQVAAERRAQRGGPALGAAPAPRATPAAAQAAPQRRPPARRRPARSTAGPGHRLRTGRSGPGRRAGRPGRRPAAAGHRRRTATAAARDAYGRTPVRSYRRRPAGPISWSGPRSAGTAEPARPPGRARGCCPARRPGWAGWPARSAAATAAGSSVARARRVRGVDGVNLGLGLAGSSPGRWSACRSARLTAWSPPSIGDGSGRGHPGDRRHRWRCRRRRDSC